MQILNALDLRAGKKAEQNPMGTLTQPIQFLTEEEKDDQWFANNADFWEWQGLKQLQRNARRLLKNYKLAKGIIDRSDYIPQENNEYNDLIDVIARDEEGALELKFYPIIPNVFNTLMNEFAKRSTKVTFHAVDPYSFNELLEQKRAEVEKVLVSQASMEVASKLIQQGLSPDDPMMQHALSIENIKTLPQIESFFKKDYRSMAETWAVHQHNIDTERFYMDELELQAFGDSLATDREFWHFKMNEDDYDIEVWNPVLTFYHKSPSVRYISQGNYVGKVDMLSIADVIDKYGYLMTEDQVKSLENVYPVQAAGYLLGGQQNDGSYYDATKSHAWNTNQPGLDFRKMTSGMDTFINGGVDVVDWVLGESEDFLDFGTNYFLRVSTIYWKTQRRIGHLTKIDDSGETMIDIVDEHYKVTDNPIYDISVFKDNTRDNLKFGEHIDWIWVNEVMGVVKVGPNKPSFWGQDNANQLTPLYLGIDKNKPGRLRFQFKGDSSLYGCKLPVEGCVFSDRNTRSTSMVDLMKPFQIGYNIVNNQIADILIDELGTVVVIDHNTIPRKSMGDDWGKNNYAKAYVAMKDFSILPLDYSLANTEGPTNFQQMQALNLEQSNRLLSRVNLANYFKTQAYETIGITGQRMGQEMGRQTATGAEQNLNASYTQTEKYFIQHSDHLMPRVHQMRTDLAQYYHSTKPSLQLSYVTTAEEKVNFEINGTELLLPQLNVFCVSKYEYRTIVEELKKLALQNNTTKASLYDLGALVQAQSLAEINMAFHTMEEKMQKTQEEERQHEIDMEKQRQEAEAAKIKEAQAFEASENQKDREAGILERQIQAAGYTGMKDTNQNGENDYVDALKDIRGSEEYQQTMDFNREKEAAKNLQHNDKIQLQRDKISAERNRDAANLQIARDKETRAEIESRRKQREKSKKK